MPEASLKGTILCTVMAAAIISGCSDDDSGTDVDTGMDVATSDTTPVDGLVIIDSARPVNEAIGALQTALFDNDAIFVFPAIDHRADALVIADETLRPTTVQMFGNTALDTPLMQVNQIAGLDLPQKILAWENVDGLTHLAYNSVDYLQQRHAISGSDAADTALQAMSEALDTFSFTASGNTEENADANQASVVSVSAGEGIITVTSAQDMQNTYDTLANSITNAESLIIVDEEDYSDNAAGIGEILNPTRLVTFINPDQSAPLMQAAQTIGIDLPQKMLVFEDAEGVVSIAYNDPTYLAARHGITGQEDRLATISDTLAGLADGAASATALP